MRIIVGAAKGRRLEVPRRGTRPLTGRAREAIFSSLAAVVSDAGVLDLYAGSGSLGLEALSRGAASCRFVERDSAAVQVLRRNVSAVGLGGEVVIEDVSRFLRSAAGTYDLVFVDPPYADEDVDTVLDLAARLMAPGSLLVVHRRAGDPEPEGEFLIPVADRRYGDVHIRVLRKEEA
jgi:16S rRNA (guanine966-N2)-methyltransferase